MTFMILKDFFFLLKILKDISISYPASKCKIAMCVLDTLDTLDYDSLVNNEIKPQILITVIPTHYYLHKH